MLDVALLLSPMLERDNLLSHVLLFYLNKDKLHILVTSTLSKINQTIILFKWTRNHSII